jgi:hypothetical protein
MGGWLAVLGAWGGANAENVGHLMAPLAPSRFLRAPGGFGKRGWPPRGSGQREEENGGQRAERRDWMCDGGAGDRMAWRLVHSPPGLPAGAGLDVRDGASGRRWVVYRKGRGMQGESGVGHEDCAQTWSMCECCLGARMPERTGRPPPRRLSRQTQRRPCAARPVDGPRGKLPAAQRALRADLESVAGSCRFHFAQSMSAPPDTAPRSGEGQIRSKSSRFPNAAARRRRSKRRSKSTVIGRLASQNANAE